MSSVQKQKFACIAHPADIDHFRDYIRVLKPEKTYKDKLLIKFFEWTPSYKVKDLPSIQIDDLHQANGAIFMVPFLPEMKEIKLKEVTEKIEQAIALAASEGCTVAALGGFTSIILQGQEEKISNKYNIKLTSGNTFTAAIIVRSIEELAKRFGLDLAQSTLAIIGASGDIGSGCTGYFCDKVKKLFLAARGINKLQEVAQKNKDITKCEIQLCTSNKDAIYKPNIVIFATSAFQEICTLNDFSPGTIVCDASFPSNVKIPGSLRPDVFIYHGGIASLPFDIDPGIDVGLASTKTFYACQVEGILIALHPELPCSWGRGNISREKLQLFLDVLDFTQNMQVVFTIGNKEYNDRELYEYVTQWKILEKKQVPVFNPRDEKP